MFVSGWLKDIPLPFREGLGVGSERSEQEGRAPPSGRIATRYDKLAANFLGFVKLASIMLWLK